LECTFAPKIQTTSSRVGEEGSVEVGDRLFKYQDKYKKNQETMKEMYKESYSFKPQISKNTDEILKNRELALEEVRNKYSIQETSTIKRRSNSSNSFPIYNNQIDEVQNEEHEETDYRQEAVVDHDIQDYYKKLESRLDE
jgi:hypothetical protein